MKFGMLNDLNFKGIVIKNTKFYRPKCYILILPDYIMLNQNLNSFKIKKHKINGESIQELILQKESPAQGKHGEANERAPPGVSKKFLLSQYSITNKLFS